MSFSSKHFFCYKLRYSIVQSIAFSLFYLFFQFSWSAFAQGDLEGSFRVRTGLSNNKTQYSFPFLTQARIHIKGEYHPSNDFKAQIHFLSSNSYKNNLSFEKFFKIYPSAMWLIGDNLELRLGRNTYENKFHQIVSLNDYEPFFHTFDGVFLEYSTKVVNVNLWGAYHPKRWIGLKQVQELKYGFGFFLDIRSISDYIESFNIHAAYLADSFFRGDSQKMSRYGLGLEGTINPIGLGYTFVTIGHGNKIQFSPEEIMRHVLLSYSFPDFFNSKIFLGYHTDSSKYNPWLYDRHQNAGLLDIFLWGNLTYYFLGLSGSAASLFDVRILFYNLSSTKKGTIQMGYFGTWITKENRHLMNAEHKSLGKELDIQLQKKISKEFEIHLLAGFFMPHAQSPEFLKKYNLYNKIQLTGLYRF